MNTDIAERLRKLQEELDLLRSVKTQEDFDEGARLHNEKNAPWIAGPYSHLRFPPYVFKAFPQMLYNEQYEDACMALAEAWRVPARGNDDEKRSIAVKQAEYLKQEATCVVADESEFERRVSSGDWYTSPLAAVEGKKAKLDTLAVAAAHRAYEDRNMGDVAKREIEAFDDASENFVAEIPVKRGPGRPAKVAV